MCNRLKDSHHPSRSNFSNNKITHNSRFRHNHCNNKNNNRRSNHNRNSNHIQLPSNHSNNRTSLVSACHHPIKALQLHLPSFS